MKRDELLARASDILRRSGTEDAERLVAELERAIPILTDADGPSRQFGIRSVLSEFRMRAGHDPASIYQQALSGCVDGLARRLATERVSSCCVWEYSVAVERLPEYRETHVTVSAREKSLMPALVAAMSRG